MPGSVLFDAPGPRARARQRIGTVVLAVALLLIAFWVYRKLDEAGQFEPRIYERLSEPNVWNAIGDGLLRTVQAAVIAIVTSLVFGFVMAIARMSDHRWVSAPATAIIEFFRAVPLLLLMIFAFYWLQRNVDALDTSAAALVAVVTGLTLYNGSVLAEVFRAGVNAVPRGQGEAAYAVGMRKYQVMGGILLPQAVRYMLPTIISQCVVVLKDTSLGAIVTYDETLRQARSIATYVGSSLVTYVLIALIFIAMNSLLSMLATWSHRRLSERGPVSAPAEADRVLDDVP